MGVNAMRVLFFLALPLVLAGCQIPAQHPAQVQKIQPSTRSTQGKHVVSWGESLYSIAWMYDRDVHELAKINHISVSHRVQAGDRLLLRAAESPLPMALSAPLSKPSRVTAESKPMNTRRNVAAAPSPEKVGAIKQKEGVSTYTWVRPAKTKGKLTQERRGLEFEGNLGDPVLAAQEGKVVYRGGGIRGYGQLIILKHANDWLSAYAHNDVILVEEGATVKAGQVIAQMGQTGTDRVKLYFEIRKKGKPVDPTGVSFSIL